MSSQEQPPAPASGAHSPVVQADPEQAALILDKLLPTLPISGLRSLTRRLGLTCNGYRRGHEPLERLVSTIIRAARRDRAIAASALDHCVEETAPVGRLVRDAKVRDLPHIIPDILGEFSPVWLWFWLGADPRRGAKALAEKVLEESLAERQSAGNPRSSSQVASRGATAGVEQRRQLRQEATARRKAEARCDRLQRELAGVRSRLDEARREAGGAGKEVGALRKEVRDLQRDKERLVMAAGHPDRRPVVVETEAYLAGAAQLEAAHREVERLTAERDSARDELWRTTLLYDRERQANERLRARMAAAPLATASGQGYSITAPFSYEGPGGQCRLRQGYGIAIPGKSVAEHDLMDGDLVHLELSAHGRTTLRVESRAARETHRAIARKVAATAPGQPSWQAVLAPGHGEFGDEPAGRRHAVLGRITDHDVARYGVRDGDLLSVLVPRPPADPAGRAALPVVRVLRTFGLPVEVERAEAQSPRRPRPRHHRRPASRQGVPRFGATAPSRPLAGKTVLIVGGDSFQVNYRAAVHGLGGTAMFLGADGEDPGRTRAKARSADVTVIVTPYVSHKVEDVVRSALRTMGQKPIMVNSTGWKTVVEALLQWAKEATIEPGPGYEIKKGETGNDDVVFRASGG